MNRVTTKSIIQSIIILISTGGRLADFDIVLLKVDPRVSKSVCAYKTGAMQLGGLESFKCNGIARYVSIRKKNMGVLTLCNVEVFGTPVSWFTLLY